MFRVFLLPDEENDATSFYISILINAIQETGDSISKTTLTNKIKKDDVVIVVSAKAFFFVWIKNPKQKIICWLQGIAPEETKMLYPKGITQFLKVTYFRIFEYLALKKSSFLFFVSTAMVKHYALKYKYRNTNYLIMPCFNQVINREYFTETKYQSPNFVYIGSLHQWQCFEETLQLFISIKTLIPHAKLTILTNEQEKAALLLKKHMLESATIKYVRVDQLNLELSNYKYGFLIREDLRVNNVATPTKMNSYLAAGIIPIYSDVILDFTNIFKENQYCIPISNHNYLTAAESIASFDRNNINPEDVYADFSKIFNSYYSKEKYIKEIIASLNKHKLIRH